MKNTPIARELIDKTIEDFHITDFAKATIREVKAIACLLYTSWRHLAVCKRERQCI